MKIWDSVTFCLNGENGILLSKNPVLRSISVYSSAYDLLSAETVLPDLDDDFDGFLRHFDDFETTEFYCINHEYVITTIDGDFVGAELLDDVLPNIREYYESENL